jgi:formamidopyrimidine-DNA glycosylase
MNYLDAYKPTAGNIAAHVKDRILDRMFKKGMGYLEVAEACQVHPARAFAELRADKEFKALVNDAREVIAERLQDEYIRISDEVATQSPTRLSG